MADTLKVTVTEPQDENLKKFQKLLAYFVEHLELCNLYDQKCGEAKINLKISNKKVKDLSKKEKEDYETAKVECWATAQKEMSLHYDHVAITGQGYNDESIQDGIKKLCLLKNGKVCISVQYGQRSQPPYISKGSYLHWAEGLAGNVSIYAEPDNEKHVAFLYIKNKWKNDNEEEILIRNSINELGISINNGDVAIEEDIKNDLIKFYECFVNAAKLETKTFLGNAKNIIFTGAPGTGKTYLAKQIAKLIGAQYEFVQFHPSYDYTDFVEGLRPVVKETENQKNIAFERKDGIFKTFCEKALEHWLLDKGVTNDKLNTFIQNKISNKVKELYKENELTKNIKNILLEDQEVKGENDQDKKSSYVFILDEINRGEISKIFGELFFSVDPGYRGVSGAVKTQYANLQEEPNLFDLVLLALGKIQDGDWGHFFIPENVYIIGTMNDIDRSVESMDFAFRRRFTFKEIKAKDTQLQILRDVCADNDERETLIETMDNLNDAITAYEEFTDAYHIGGAYFRHYKDYVGQDNQMDKLWDNHIKGVLIEYLRGRPDCGKRLDELKANYYNGLFGKIGIKEKKLREYLTKNETYKNNTEEIIEEIKGILRENIEIKKEEIFTHPVSSMGNTSLKDIVSKVKNGTNNIVNETPSA